MEKQIRKRNMDLTSGSIWNKILIFALPLAASSILQQLFNSADVAIVGHFAGSRALAAVGSNGAVINLLVNIFVGLSVGANVIIARYLGQRNEERVHKAVHTAILVAILSGLIIMFLGIIITKPILELMSTPDDIIDLAVVYLRIYFLGMPFMMVYNFGAAILRSMGDTKRPFLCLLISGIVNVILNLFFVIVCKLSVAGVAIATVSSNIISACMVIYFLTHEEGPVKLSLKELSIDGRILKDITKIGLPAGLQGVVFSFSNICAQSALNTLGSDVVAGSAAALNFEYFVFFLLNAFTQACVTFTSQNYGAGNFARCKRVTLLCSIMGTVFPTILSAAFLLLGETALKFYTTEPAVIAVGLVRMRYCLVFQFTSALMDVLSGSMRGLGYSLLPAILSLIGSCGLRLLWIYTIFPQAPSFERLLVVYPVTWAMTSLSMLIAYMWVSRRVMKTKIPAMANTKDVKI
ncbi:MAG: MATE family efflux transporter [Oscillospiraceae bacterium]|nr:MATE family efflux transporter [Oscillospiraceae bacterium]